MSNQRFPPSTFDAVRLESRVAFFETLVQSGDSGAEYRIRRRTDGGYRYRLTIQCRMWLDEHTDLFGFFAAHGGAHESFLFTDPMDGTERRVRFDQDDIEGSFEPGVYTVSVELVTVVVP